MNKVAKLEFNSDKNVETLKECFAKYFNLNPERKSDFEDFFKHENSKYQGILKSDNTFSIKANELIFSKNNGIDFFFTTVHGKISEENNKTLVKLEAELSRPIMTILLVSTIIYLIIMYFSFSSGIFGVTIFVGIYFYARRKVKDDFEIFKNEILQILNRY
ncbi:hypothetical protein [Riemerella anatipestifer]|uniref:Uncharacterized protein n=1 Tax=Riemerella anatipestifer TaxID=34085 RepID=A0AAP6LMT2_RIEAN|nr:hypothetical protein [Riemerella anatipestifer]MBO4234259.1 hypothetical protein [Riemerella anatipestifer]MBT0549953.1 hypothetical protein [Riemerella anatipestifer]MBT0556775.1 hypothetical protein [Riemerella anatipestifer]MBT0560741.1 hypothetical protein [Riemerella anatipestifer]MCD5968317.1 hypothetical protein [Riemerella anatipestifer]